LVFINIAPRNSQIQPIEMKVEKLEIKNKLIEAISAVTKLESDKKIDKAIKKVAENLAELIIDDRKKAKKKAEKKAKQEEKKAAKVEKIKPKKISTPKVVVSKSDKPSDVVN
jgi:hypothetical protein